MIDYVTADDYFGKWMDHPDATDAIKNDSIRFLEKINDLLDVAFMDGVDLPINPKTNSLISGKEYGGFRPQDCPQGSPSSSHKVGRGIDIYDPEGQFDDWCLRHPQDLRDRGLFMEDPHYTKGWCHITDRPPRSGKLVFIP